MTDILERNNLYHSPRTEISGTNPVKRLSIPFHSPQSCGSFKLKQWTMPKTSAQCIKKHDRQNCLKLHESGELTQPHLAKFTASYH